MKQPSWLSSAVFYNIYPQSFYDTNADGIGDLNGVRAKLPYIRDMGFTAVWLNPFYESPFRDAGYDITDFYKVAPRYGTNEDFAALCTAAHEYGIKVVVDLVAGHTALECEWFQKSALPEKNEYTNRYVWTDDWLKNYDGSCIGGYPATEYGSRFVHRRNAMNPNIDFLGICQLLKALRTVGFSETEIKKIARRIAVELGANFTLYA